MLDPSSQKSSFLSLIPLEKLDNCLKMLACYPSCLVLESRPR